MSEMLTEAEKAFIEKAGSLMGDLRDIVGNGRTRAADLSEMCNHIHAIQNAVLAQAAARAYPEEFRLMGDSFDDRKTMRDESDDDRG